MCSPSTTCLDCLRGRLATGGGFAVRKLCSDQEELLFDEEASKSEVEYIIHPSVGKLADVRIVPAGQLEHRGSSPTCRMDHFDLSFPRKIASYDKMGGRILCSAMRALVGPASDAKGFSKTTPILVEDS
jgi:hypothetical protein